MPKTNVRNNFFFFKIILNVYEKVRSCIVYINDKESAMQTFGSQEEFA